MDNIFDYNSNESLSDSLNQLTNLSILTFGSNFNQPLSESLNQLTNLSKLTFGSDFNQPLSDFFNQLTNLSKLTFGYNFNQYIYLPFNIKYLKLNCNNQYIIENLHNNIEELELRYYFNLKLNNLPISIKKISFNIYSCYNNKLNNLPNSIEYLELPYNYNHQIKNIPKKLKLIKYNNKYKYINDFINYQVITRLEYIKLIYFLMF